MLPEPSPTASGSALQGCPVTWRVPLPKIAGIPQAPEVMALRRVAALLLGAAEC
jgi:hypothetical protein